MKTQAVSGWLLAALMLGHLSQGLTFTAFAPALPQLAVDFGGGAQGEFVAQMTLMIAALGMMCGALASGWIIEWLGPGAVMWGALLLYGALGSGGLMLHSVALLLASRFGVGFVCACMVTACVSQIAARCEGERRARVLGLSGAMASLISLAAMLLGGTLARYWGWRFSFIQYPLFAVAGLFVLTVAPSLGGVTRRLENRPIGRDYLRRLWPLYAVTLVLSGVMFMGSTQFSFLLAQDGVSDPAHRSLIMSTVTLVAVCTSLTYGRLQARFGLLGTLVVGALSMSLALLMADLTSTPVLAAVAAALMGIFVGILIPFLHHYVTEHAAERERGHAIGILNACNFLGGFLNPLVFVPLARGWGLRAVFLMAAMVMFAIAAGTLAIARAARRELRVT